MKRAESVVQDSIDYLGEVEVSHILCTTALEILSYAHPLRNELENLMHDQIDWNAPGSVNRIKPDELEGILGCAEIEVSNGFQHLSMQALVSLWAGLESMIEDLFVAWILDFPDCLEHKDIRNLKISLSEFLHLDEESRIRALYDLYVSQTQGAKSHGIKRFEVVLKPLGLSGTVDEDVSNAIYELNILRNLIAHNRCRVDLKFSKTGFGEKYKLGETVYIYERQFRNYCAATMSYADIILNRIKENHAKT